METPKFERHEIFSGNPERYKPDVEVEPELAVMCGLDPRIDCPGECPNYNFMKRMWSEIAGSQESYSRLVEKFRDPNNAKLVEDFRRQQSEMFGRQALYRLCLNYPEADIAHK